ncbi:melanopsin isoform X2 [Anolis carolinensis]|uniref:G-protein coupled receptors family 1 profile domain-containing protein n=1 Tax=Anolis carolinensis TaxID=28377 RepID=A0A803SRR7_ANOCA|nr:PREDICTED: melanopsin isoform X2 [Anolis carolinensis]|eukprot:XP_008117317.1 PREDICTED: melanopsin isoform X2 [Anolis carolinensis]
MSTRLVDLAPLVPTERTMFNLPDPFPTVDVPTHAHYTIGAVILVVGITGTLGNLLVIYVFFRIRGLRTPANMFVINLAVSDFLMAITQCPVFFTNSLNKRWIFGAKGCELYAFCGALFGIASMITLTVIALDRYFVITRPLASIGAMSTKKALLILSGVWLYSLAWSLPPFFGWSAYVPEGLLTSCSWDYITFTPSVRAYTMLLFCFVFFIPLIAIIYSYVFIFIAIKNSNRAVQRTNSDNSKEGQKLYQKLKNEWKMAKVALIVILLYVISWSPYSVVALVAFAGYSHLLTPYMNSVPAVIAKASVIHNPIIYAIVHPKYRMAIAKFLPCLGSLLRVPRKDSSYPSTRRPTVTSQSSDINGVPRGHRRLSSVSDSESDWTDTEADISSQNSRVASGSISYRIYEDTTETIKVKSKMRSHDSGIFERDLPFGVYNLEDSLTGEDLNAFGWRREESYSGPSTSSQIPSIIVTFSNVQRTDLPLESSSGALCSRNSSYSWEKDSNSRLEWLCHASALAPTSERNMCQLSVEDLARQV